MTVSTTIRCFCSLALLTGTVLAEQHEIRWYDVEVIIFENTNVPQSSNTHWSTQAYVPLLENAFALDPLSQLEKTRPAVTDIIIDDANELAAVSLEPRLLPPETHRLAGEAATIVDSSRYKLLVHQAWRQAGSAREHAIPIHIRRGDPIPAFEFSAETESQVPSFFSAFGLSNAETSLQMEGLEGLEVPAEIPPPIITVDNYRPVFARPSLDRVGNYTQTLAYPLDGTITVALSRFLHVYTDLALTKTGLSKSGYELQSFIVKTHRRMRSRKLHYIDHPKLGMLVLITPYEPDAEL